VRRKLPTPHTENVATLPYKIKKKTFSTINRLWHSAGHVLTGSHRLTFSEMIHHASPRQRRRNDFDIARANILWEWAYALAEFLFIEILAGDVCFVNLFRSRPILPVVPTECDVLITCRHHNNKEWKFKEQHAKMWENIAGAIRYSRPRGFSSVSKFIRIITSMDFSDYLHCF